MAENKKVQRIKNYFERKYDKQLDLDKTIETLDGIGMSTVVLSSLVGFGSMLHSCAGGDFMDGPSDVCLVSTGLIVGGFLFHSLCENIRKKTYKKGKKYESLISDVEGIEKDLSHAEELKAREQSISDRARELSRFCLGGEYEQLAITEESEIDPNQLTIESFDMGI